MTASPRSEGSGAAWPVAVCLFMSGLCALIYQMSWLREFRLIFGASTAASAAVLAIFMAGVGWGSLALGRRVDRLANPFRFYAALEALVAVSAALTPWLLALARHAYLGLGGTTVLGMTAGTVLRLLLAALVLFVPTFLMGGTLPAAAKALQSETDARRRSVAILYGANALGAVTGTLVATFVLFELLGQRWTLWSASAVNLLIALLAWLLSATKHFQGQPEASPRLRAGRDAFHRVPNFDEDQTGPKSAAPTRFVLAAAATVGFAFFLLELVWYRMLGPLLGGSTFTFGLILAVALLGIAMGSFLFSMWRSDRPVTLSTFALTCGLEGLAVAVPYALGDRLAVLAILLHPLGEVSFPMRVLEWSVLTMIVVWPASLLAGLQFPMLIALLGRGVRSLGSHTGLAYGWNTGGAIAGSLAGGFGLLPILTAPGTWLLVAAVLVVLGMAALAISVQSDRRWKLLLLPLSVAAAALWLMTCTGPTAAWRHTPIGAGRVQVKGASANDFLDLIYNRRRVLLWEAEGRESSVAVTISDGLAFVVNGKVDGNARSDAPTQVMVGLLGAFFHPEPARSLVIGLGTGSTAGWLADIPQMEQVDVVELEPAMRTVAEQCAAVNRHALANPKLRLHFGDAREVILTMREQYDLIASEPSNPYRAGVASLFTREFYEAAAKRLRPGGLFMQWVQAYEIDGASMSTVYATLHAAFPAIETWQTQFGDLLFIAGQTPITYDLALLRERLSQEPYRSAFPLAWRVTDLEGVFARYIANRELAVAAADAGAPLNTDDCNVLEFAFARTVGRKAEFDLEMLRRLATEHGFHQPAVVRGELAWPKIYDQRCSSCVLEGIAKFTVADKDEGLRFRATAKEAYASGDLERAWALWQRQPEEPDDLIELALVAESLAARADPRAVKHLETLRAWLPNEADAIFARYLWQKEHSAQVVTVLEKCLLNFRRDPWTLPDVLVRTLELAKDVGVSANSPQYAERLYQALEGPLAVYLAEAEKNQSRLDLAGRLDNFKVGSHTRDVLAEMEPHVPWSRDLLRLRAQCYGQLQDPQATTARRDLAKFMEYQARPFVYRSVATPAATSGEPPPPALALEPSMKVHARER